ncbi:unnamed protein product [Bathycoccus prasinos]
MSCKKAKRKAKTATKTSREKQRNKRRKENDKERGKSNEDEVEVDDSRGDSGGYEYKDAAERDARISRTSLVSVLDGSEKKEEVSHSWRREHAKLYVDAGVVKKGEEENVDVVQEQQLPVGDGAAFAFMIALMIFGKYACGIGHTYETNKTAKALQREVMKNLDVNALVLQASTATATKETTEEAVPMKVEMAKKDEATMKEVLTIEEEEEEEEEEAEAVPMSTSTSSMSKMTKGFESSLLRKACESAMEIMGDPDAPLASEIDAGRETEEEREATVAKKLEEFISTIVVPASEEEKSQAREELSSTIEELKEKRAKMRRAREMEEGQKRAEKDGKRGKLPTEEEEVVTAMEEEEAEAEAERRLLGLLFYWVDICPISSTTTNAAVFDESIIGEVLGQNKSLQDEYFGRSREALLSLTKNAMFVSMNKYPICYPAGEAVDENAIEKWLKLGYLRIKETIYEEQPYKVQLVEVNVSDNDEEKWQMTLFVRGGHHPSAHLRREPSIVEDFKITCGLLAASICFVNVGNKKFFKECLSAASERRLEVVKKRRVMFQELLKIYHEKLLREAYEPNQNLLLLYKREFVHLRHIELEVKEVAENFEWFLKENDSDSVLKHLKLESFVKGLGRSESSTKFRKSLTTLKGNSELLKKIENALSSNSFYAALAEKGDAYLDALAKARTSGAFKGIDAAYANAMGSGSFHAAFKEKGDAYLDALAKARTSGAFKGIDAAYANAIGVDSFHSAFSKKGDAYLDALAKARTSGAFKGIDAAYANAMGSGSFHSAFSKKGDAYLDALAKARTSGAFKGIDAAYANAMGSGSFHSAFSKKGDAYLDELAKARTSGAFKGIDAAYANFMGSNSFLSAYAKKGDAFLKELEGVKAAQIFARNPDAIERAQKKGSYNAAVNKLGGDKLRERLDKLVLPSNAFGGNEELLNKGMGVNGFHSAIANADENAVRSFLAKLNSAKKKLTMNGDASLFEVAMTNDSFLACISNKNGCDDFINLLGRMITSQAFVDNPQARKNAIRGRPVLRALFKRGEGFLTALVEVQQKSYRNKKAFAVQLGRVDKKYGTTCREFVDEILLRLSTAGQVLQHQQQPPQPPQQQKHQREEKQQQQEHREVQNRFASGAKRKRAEDGEASARIDEAQQLPLAQTVPQQQQQQQQQLVRGNRVKIYGDIPSAKENFTGLTPKQINTRRNKLKGEKGEIIEIVNNPGKKHTQYIVKLNNTIRVSGKPLPKTFSVLASNLISLA